MTHLTDFARNPTRRSHPHGALHHEMATTTPETRANLVFDGNYLASGRGGIALRNARRQRANHPYQTGYSRRSLVLISPFKINGDVFGTSTKEK